MVETTAENRSNSELDDSRAPFMEHLQELRVRLWYAILGVFGAAIVCFMFSDALYNFLTDPLYTVLDKYTETLGEEPKLVSRTVTGAFMFHFKAALLGGVFFGVPIILYQFWQFVAPGLYRSERKLALPFVFLSTACFVTGGYFAYAFVLPAAFDFLIGYGIKLGPKKLIPEIAIEDYLGITTKLLLSFGIVFEMPVAVAFLSWIGAVTHLTLIRFWRWAVVLAFVLGAMLTPPDLISQLFLAIPLVALYGLSIGISFIITKRRALIEGESPDDDPDDDPGGEPMPQPDDRGGGSPAIGSTEGGTAALPDRSNGTDSSLSDSIGPEVEGSTDGDDGRAIQAESMAPSTADELTTANDVHEITQAEASPEPSASRAENEDEAMDAFARRQLNLSLDTPEQADAPPSTNSMATSTDDVADDDEQS
ncbi:MAG: twin-arginine translocase subunit TatC [Myxococcota bacterium]|nr:twin-arginine translocase subunit TatC [Myxococcota bacterium]